MSTPLRNQSPTTLRLVRYAMLIFLLIFGGIAYRQGTIRIAPPDPAPLEMFRWVGMGLCVAAMFAIVLFRGIRARVEGSARFTWSLVGSALAEGVTLFGAVILFMGGDIWVYALGLLIFLATWGILPADPDAA